MATFESMDRRMPKIEACLKANGLESLDACREMLLEKGIDCDAIVKGVQPICFENAVWAYTLGTAIAVKRGLKNAAECAAAIGEGLEAFTIPGSVAEQRKVGLGHGNLGAMLLSDDTKCFAFLAGHESFAAAEGAIGIARTANKARKTPLRVILNGLGKGLRSMTGTIFSTKAKGVRYLELTEGYILKTALDENNEVIGYQFVRLGKMLEAIRHGEDPKTAFEKNVGTYGRFDGAAKYIDPREE